MKVSVKRIVLFFILLINFSSYAQKKHTIEFSNVESMYEYFKYTPDRKIISGHRGTRENCKPENSIAAMEEVLKYTPAIFEIDPRLSKDSIPVVIHDSTLDRTTTGKGKVNEYTWKELKSLKLKDDKGNVTKFRINTLDEMILWAKGKTILNLDKKDLPLELTAEIIRKHNAYSWVWVTVHDVTQAKFYLDKNPKQYLAMHIKDSNALDNFINSNLPFDRMIVYIGSKIKDSNKEIFDFFKKKGVMCMISSASSYDKLSKENDRAAEYRAVFNDGVNILESDFPIEVSKAIKLD